MNYFHAFKLIRKYNCWRFLFLTSPILLILVQAFYIADFDDCLAAAMNGNPFLPRIAQYVKGLLQLVVLLRNNYLLIFL